LVATSGYTGDSTPSLRRKLIPIGSYIIVTEILPAGIAAEEVSPRNRMIYNSLYYTHYYRLTRTGECSSEGRAAFFPENETRFAKGPAILRRDMVRIFPQLADTKIDYVWEVRSIYVRYDAARRKNGRLALLRGIRGPRRCHGYSAGAQDGGAHCVRLCNAGCEPVRGNSVQRLRRSVSIAADRGFCRSRECGSVFSTS